MRTGEYETILDKMALAVESTKVAKESAVSEEGIGEDININIFCWKGNSLVSILQLKHTHLLERDERLERITQAACLMRQGWEIDEYTMIAEGYCSLKPAETKEHDLASLFAQMDSPVKECISFTHISLDEILFVSLPYSVGLGKEITFDKPLWYPGIDVLRDLAYPAVLRASLKLELQGIDREELDKPVFFEVLARGINEFGFEVFYRDDI